MNRIHNCIRVIMLLSLLLTGVSAAPAPAMAQDTITSATLWLYVANIWNAPQVLRIHQVTTDWTETGVTWATRPNYLPEVAATGAPAPGWIQIDITSLAKTWASDPTRNYGIYLEQDLTTTTQYSSREGTNPPYLVLCSDSCQTLYPVADAYMYAYYPTVNYGAAWELWTGTMYEVPKQSLLRFELPDFPGAGDEGCTPGYWKQSHHFDSWWKYSPNQTLESVFDVPDAYGLDNVSLAEALGFGGGSGVVGGAKILLRAAVAALLNSVQLDYPLSESAVIAQVNSALASGNRPTMLALADTLDAYNNYGCPLN